MHAFIHTTSHAQAQAKQAEQPEVWRASMVRMRTGSSNPEDETELHNEGLLFAGCELGHMIDFDPRRRGAAGWQA